MVNTFFCIRHGTCDRDPETQKYSHPSVLLNKQGQTEITHVSRLWMDSLLSFSPSASFSFKIYCSPLPRVLDTVRLFLSSCLLYPSLIHVHIQKEERLSNQQADDAQFEVSLRSLLQEISSHNNNNNNNNKHEYVLFMTHGRIIKMIECLLHQGHLDRDFMNQLPDIEQTRVYSFDLERR